MANEKISQLPAASALTGDELVPIVKNGVTMHATLSQLAALASGGGTGSLDGLTGTATGQLIVWDNTLSQWVVVTPSPASASVIPASSAGMVNSHGSTTQAILNDFDHAISGGGGGGGGGPIVADTFTRPDALVPGTADTGQAWSVLQGTWGIQSNRLYRTTAALGDALAIETAVTDMLVQVTMPVLGGIPSSDESVMARVTDANNYYAAVKTGSNLLRLVKKVAGTATTLIADTNCGTWAAGDSIGIQAHGSTISMLRNSVVIGSVTDTAFSSPTKAGIRLGNTDHAARFDAFQVDPG